MTSCRSRCYGPRAALVAATVGCLLCVAFGVMFYYIPDIVNSLVYVILPLSPGSFAYSFWQKIPFKLYRQIYVFNYTNTDDFKQWGKNGVRPMVTQLGPYTYTEEREKIFLNWDDPPYVGYRETHKFKFVPEMSVGSEDDPVIFPNPVSIVYSIASKFLSTCTLTMSIIHLIQLLTPKIPVDLQPLWNTVLATKLLPIFQNQKVGDLLFYGYKDEFVQFAQEYVLNIELFPEGNVALMYGKNATDDGKYLMNRGIDDHTKMYQIVEWNDQSSLKYWGDQYCNMINGSDGTMYPTNLHKGDRVYAFISYIRRSIYMNYTNDMKFKDVDGYGFSIPFELYGDLNVNPDNHCFVLDDPDVSFATGVIYVGPLLLNTAIYASNPHFLGADFRLVDAIDGLHPNPEEHTCKMNVHTKLGIPLSGDLRIQGNLLMQPTENITKTRNWPTIMLPILWLNESAELDDATMDLLNTKYYGGQKLVYSVTIILIIITGLVSLAGIACAFKQTFDYKKTLVILGTERLEFQEINDIKNKLN